MLNNGKIGITSKYWSCKSSRVGPNDLPRNVSVWQQEKKKAVLNEAKEKEESLQPVGSKPSWAMVLFGHGGWGPRCWVLKTRATYLGVY